MEKKMKKAKGRKWTVEEDRKLLQYVEKYGVGDWKTVAQNLGIGKSGNSCSQRWHNYLSPDIVHAHFTHEERLQILRLHSEFGNRWARIAGHLPCRTDNAVKNFFYTHLTKEARLLNVDASTLSPPAGGVGGGTFGKYSVAHVDACSWDAYHQSFGNPNIDDEEEGFNADFWCNPAAFIWSLDYPPSFGP